MPPSDDPFPGIGIVRIIVVVIVIVFTLTVLALAVGSFLWALDWVADLFRR